MSQESDTEGQGAVKVWKNSNNQLFPLQARLPFLLPLVAILLGSCSPASSLSSSSNRVFRGAYRVGRHSGRPPSFTLTVDQVFREANEKFSYRGTPIHPGLIQEFQCWQSDLNPVTIVVDVSAASDSNEYSSDTYKHGEYLSIRTDEGKGEFGYARMSAAKDGVHILKTWAHGGGSGVFRSELWVKFEVGQGFYADGEPYDQLLLRLVRAK